MILKGRRIYLWQFALPAFRVCHRRHAYFMRIGGICCCKPCRRRFASCDSLWCFPVSVRLHSHVVILCVVFVVANMHIPTQAHRSTCHYKPCHINRLLRFVLVSFRHGSAAFTCCNTCCMQFKRYPYHVSPCISR